MIINTFFHKNIPLFIDIYSGYGAPQSKYSLFTILPGFEQDKIVYNKKTKKDSPQKEIEKIVLSK